MKPKEFDELIKQKFDRNDFAYNPESWGRLAEKLEGRDKKRSLIVWWWIPLAGMAASVALAFGVSTLLRMSSTVNIGGDIAKTQKSNYAQPHTFSHEPGIMHDEIAVNTNDNSVNNANSAASDKTKKNTRNAHKNIAGKMTEESTTDWTEVTLMNALKNIVAKNTKPFNLLSKDAATPVDKNKKIVPDEVVNTFKPEEEVKKAPKLSLILSGGVNHGSENSGYVAGATIRRMVNDKLYVESDVAFASSSNTQMTEYAVPQAAASHTEARQSHTGARTTSTSADGSKALPVNPEADIIDSKNVSYNLYYAQVSPSLGYKVIKRMSIGLGPDFQKMLVNNQPAPSTVDRNVIQVNPLFDVGFIGKTEYMLTKKVKAGVSYRKGVNNIITPTDKYIDRDYLQFQVKYTIFNK